MEYTKRERLRNTVCALFQIWCYENKVNRNALGLINIIDFMTDFFIKYERKNCIDCFKRLIILKKHKRN